MSAQPASVPPSGRAKQRASRSSPTAEGGYPLAGISELPDPDYHAYRQDLADVALAGRVIASHYAEPVIRHLLAPASFYRAAGDQAEIIGELQAGDEFAMLDDTRGWAWGYAGADHRVGYVRAEALGG